MNIVLISYGLHIFRIYFRKAFHMRQPICPSPSFKSNTEAYTEPRNEPFIWTTEVDYSNTFNHDQVQVLSYSKLLFLPVVFF